MAPPIRISKCRWGAVEDPVEPTSPIAQDASHLGWAVGYNAIALSIAAGIFAPTFGLVLRPEIAALSMSGSSVMVAVNALMLKRLRLARPVDDPPTKHTEQAAGVDIAVNLTEAN